MKMIDEQRQDHAVELLCELTRIQSSSYYRWKKEPVPTKRIIEDEQLRVKIKESYKESRETYGRPRIHEDLRKKGVQVGKKRIARLMKEEGIVGCYNEPAKPKTTDSKHNYRVSENLLKKREFPSKAREVIVTDTTYVWTDCGWYYLATVMDLFNREIIGSAFSVNNDRHLVCQALWDAANELSGYEGMIHHSDRGSTYCSDDYRNLIEQMGMVSSMSAKGYCYDNAHMESFFGSLKCECTALHQSLSPKQVKLALFDYIQGFYNTHRIHSALGGLSPKEFRNLAATPMGVIES